MKIYSKTIIDEYTRKIAILGIPFQCEKNYNSEKNNIEYKFTFHWLTFTLIKRIKQQTKTRVLPKDKGHYDALIYLKCIRNLFEKIDTVETMFLGSSTMRVGYIENEKTINFGIDAQDLYYSYMLFHKYVKIIPNLKNVVLGFDPFSCGNDLDKHPQIYRQCYYKAYMDIPYKNKLNIIQKDLIKFEDYLLKLKKYIDKKLPNVPRDCMSSYSIGKITEARLKSLVEGELKLSNKVTMLHYLEYLIQDCKKYDINLHIVCMPRNPLTKKYYPTTDILYSSLFELMANYNNAKIYNAFDELDLECRDFLDLCHLSRNGATKFSKYINNKIGILE